MLGILGISSSKKNGMLNSQQSNWTMKSDRLTRNRFVHSFNVEFKIKLGRNHGLVGIGKLYLFLQFDNKVFNCIYLEHIYCDEWLVFISFGYYTMPT